jgi:hypothetical protein
MRRALFGAVALVAIVCLREAASASATTVDVYDGYIEDGYKLTSYFRGLGYTVNLLNPDFVSLTGANLVILTQPGGLGSGDPLSFSSAQLNAINDYVDQGGRLLLNSEGVAYKVSIIAVNRILFSLGSSIINLDTAYDDDFHDTTNIVSNHFTTGVHDINYAYTSSLSGGTPLAYGVSGQVFVSFQMIGSGNVFVITDYDTEDHIESTSTNDNGVLYCNFGGLPCGAAPIAPVSEPLSLALLGTGVISLALTRSRARQRTLVALRQVDATTTREMLPDSDI